MGKEEIARNEQFLLFPQCFLLNHTIVSLFVSILDIISLFAVELEAPTIGISGRGLMHVKVLISPVKTCFMHYIYICCIHKFSGILLRLYGGYLFFSVKDRNLFHRVVTIGNIFTSGADEINFDLSPKKKIFLFHAFNPFLEKLYQNLDKFFFVILRGVPLPHSNAITILRQAREMLR